MSNEEYLISLLASALNNKPLQIQPQDIDFEKVFKLACMHNVNGIAFYGIEKACRKPDEKIYARWKEKYQREIVKNIKQLKELEEVSRLFSENHIVHLPLKGCVLKKMYQRADMRSMADMDILIYPADEEKVKNLLIGRGYTCTAYDITNHDVYRKEPIYNIEIHTSLFRKRNTEFFRYYDNFLKRTLPGENEYARIMSDEDFYVYNIAHFNKHFKVAGSGIRSVMDIYVMNRTFEGHIDRAYVDNQLSQLNLLGFEKTVVDLSKFWFGAGAYRSELDETANYIIGSGTYGKMSNMIENQLENQGKFKLLLHNVFPTYENMIYQFHILKKAPFLLPVFWVWRLVFSVIKKPKAVKNKIKLVLNAIMKRTDNKDS